MYYDTKHIDKCQYEIKLSAGGASQSGLFREAPFLQAAFPRPLCVIKNARPGERRMEKAFSGQRYAKDRKESAGLFFSRQLSLCPSPAAKAGFTSPSPRGAAGGAVPRRGPLFGFAPAPYVPLKRPPGPGKTPRPAGGGLRAARGISAQPLPGEIAAAQRGTRQPRARHERKTLGRRQVQSPRQHERKKRRPYSMPRALF